MLFLETLQTAIFSIMFISLIHYLFNYFQENLTTPIVKDLVHGPYDKYQKMHEIINTPNRNMNNTIYTNTTSLQELNRHPSNANMKEALQTFLKEQMNT